MLTFCREFIRAHHKIHSLLWLPKSLERARKFLMSRLNWSGDKIRLLTDGYIITRVEGDPPPLRSFNLTQGYQCVHKIRQVIIKKCINITNINILGIQI